MIIILFFDKFKSFVHFSVDIGMAYLEVGLTMDVRFLVL